MPTAQNALIKYEASQSLIDFTALTAAVDEDGAYVIYPFDDSIVSKRSGYEPVIRPDGIASGVNIIKPAVSATDDYVDTIEFTAFFAGTLVTVSADTDLSCTRGVDSSTAYIINSVVCNSSGVLSVVTGTGSTAFSATRGAAGGPPSIPVGSVEVGQIRFTSETSAAVVAADIAQSVEAGQSERYDYPTWKEPINTTGYGNQAKITSKETSYLEFVKELPVIHGATPTAAATDRKAVYAKYYVPDFVSIDKCTDFVPSQSSFSISSTQIYQMALGSSTESLGAASLTAYFEDGITDALAKLEGEVITFLFWPDENKSAYMVTQGILGLNRSYPAADQITAACTIASEQKSVGFDS